VNKQVLKPKSVGDFEEPIDIGYRASQSQGCAQTGCWRSSCQGHWKYGCSHFNGNMNAKYSDSKSS